MRRQVYAFDPSVNTYRHMYIDRGVGQVARLRGTAITPRTAKNGMGNHGRKVTGRGAA